ncbi:UvrD-helicase domain-containing protein [Hymenobacter properus]|uniref:DNA 3'-5' helicase n=1 Tax=Hymenobacter properus TaxID=2791026 RepID=A0A931BG03_9BACT|nr:ATP-dependent helicase [Hymenobacter properus]MBF9141801.1 ATP-dependent helicase [Hymenobacter properus]MBR7720609.1 ATP-dependent helicase [Microvirga sp. SRT04]
MPVKTIISDDLIDIEQHFRVAAGPGAGKTHWLVNHIKNVLHNSTRLQKTRAVACITYTNVAAETIIQRLQLASSRVEVSTIHAFLYKHIVKPYLSFIDTKHGLNIEKVEGHDDTILSNYSLLKDWKTNTNQRRITDDTAVVEAIKAARWRFNTNGELEVRPDRPYKANNYSIRTISYLEYKKLAWQKGILHHDDVLFFSYELIKNNPFIISVIRAKFPYFFIDEFQDTNPIQTYIIEQIGQSETIIGVIGDKAQSIYGFQGAKPDNFDSVQLQNLNTLQIQANRRSTIAIINLLNSIRNDITQTPVRNDIGDKPIVIVNNPVSALAIAQAIIGQETIHSITRLNITSNLIRKSLSAASTNGNLLEKITDIDKPSQSNNYRSKVIQGFIKATEWAQEGRYKEALAELDKVFKHKSKNERAKDNLKYIITLCEKYDSFKTKKLYEYFLIIRNELNVDISDLRTGAGKNFYENHTYQELALCVRIPEDNGLHRTIHKSKGAEFNNVLVALTEEKDIDFLIKPNLQLEDHRVSYVAISRAKNRLFISVPTLSSTNRVALEQKGFVIQ